MGTYCCDRRAESGPQQKTRRKGSDKRRRARGEGHPPIPDPYAAPPSPLLEFVTQAGAKEIQDRGRRRGVEAMATVIDPLTGHLE